jgi:hypothetical protein
MRRLVTTATIHLLLLFVFLTLYGTSLAADYFPLKVGNLWVYNPSYGDGNRVDKIIGTGKVGGRLTYIWRRTEAPPDNYIEKRWLAKTSSAVKVYKYWGNEGGVADPILLNPPWVQDELIPKVGDSWSFQLSIDPFTYTGHFYVESVNCKVTVPAGTFTNCVRIRQLDEQNDGVSTKLTYRKRWLAPNVGPVMYNKYGSNWRGLTFSQKLIRYVIK